MLKPRCKTRATRDPAGFRTALGAWFRRHGRDLPWRRTHDPYAILVSELMLQQTQVTTVLAGGYFERFLAAFPTPQALAVANDDALLKAWEGLGYYRRARLLRDAARTVIETHGGRFPRDLDALLALPGVGRYTAGALRAFAFGLPAVLVDGNIARVISRICDFRDPIDTSAGQAEIWKTAGKLACDAHPRVHHAALMELGQTHCRPGAPDCLACPVAQWCASRSPHTLPVKKAKAGPTRIDEHAVWWLDAAGRLLLHREQGGRRNGLWRLPLRQPAETAGLPVIAREEYAITRYKVSLAVHDARHVSTPPALENGDVPLHPDAIPELAMAAPFRRVVERLLGITEESV